MAAEFSLQLLGYEPGKETYYENTFLPQGAGKLLAAT